MYALLLVSVRVRWNARYEKQNKVLFGRRAVENGKAQWTGSFRAWMSLPFPPPGRGLPAKFANSARMSRAWWIGLSSVNRVAKLLDQFFPLLGAHAWLEFIDQLYVFAFGLHTLLDEFPASSHVASKLLHFFWVAIGAVQVSARFRPFAHKGARVNRFAISVH
jgi:hypothetical protein